MLLAHNCGGHPFDISAGVVDFRAVICGSAGIRRGLRTLDRPCGYQVYNLGNGEPTRLKDFIDIVQRCTERKAIIKILPDQPGDVPRTCADITKARTLLGYNPSTKFSDGMAKTVEWYKTSYAPKLEADAAKAPASALARPVSTLNFRSEVL